MRYTVLLLVPSRCTRNAQSSARLSSRSLAGPQAEGLHRADISPAETITRQRRDRRDRQGIQFSLSMPAVGAAMIPRDELTMDRWSSGGPPEERG